MTVIDHIIAFCASLDPDFPRRIRGSTPDQIAALAGAMGREPSALHRAFLERMGEDQGPLSLGLYGVSPSRLIAYEPEMIAGMPEGISLFAVPLGDDEEQIYLLGGDDPEVVRCDGVPLDEAGTVDPSRAEPVAGSLSELLCLPFLNARVAVKKPHQASYTEKVQRADTLARCRSIAALFGFEPYWFSNASTFAAHRGSMVLVAKQARGFYFSMGLAGDDELEWGVVFRTLTRELDLEIFR